MGKLLTESAEALMAWKQEEVAVDLSKIDINRTKVWNVVGNEHILISLKECYDIIEEKKVDDKTTIYKFKMKEGMRGKVLIETEAEYQQVTYTRK
jgi:hypothetical protein